MLRISTWLQRADSSPVVAPETGALGWAESKALPSYQGLQKGHQPPNFSVKIKPFVHSGCVL